MEITGVVLGVVPIVLAALQQYGTLYKVCKRYKRCQAGVEELLSTLKVQQVIFNTETRLLLTAVVGDEDAKAMVNDPGHHLWKDKVIDAQLLLVLDSSKDALEAAARHAYDKMRKMEDEINKFSSEEQQGSSSGKTSIKDWKKTARSRFKFSISETKLANMSRTIREATADYRILRAQIQETISLRPDAPSDKSQSKELGRIKATKAAAQHVYKVLAAACRLHMKHHAQFGLKPSYTSSTSGTQVKFQLAYQHVAQQRQPQSRDVLWFVVESLILSNLSTVPRALPLLPSSDNATQSRNSSMLPTLKKLQGSVQGKAQTKKVQSPSVVASSSSTISSTETIKSPVSSTIPDLGTTVDICTQLESHCTHSNQSDTCIGLLKNSTEWEHRVYPSSGPTSQTINDNVTGHFNRLVSLFGSLRSSPNGGMGLTVLQRLRLAKIISTATLTLHATPWLQPSWSSQDIILYNFATPRCLGGGPSELEAFIDVPVGQRCGDSDHQTSTYAIAPFVRNSVLFSLGVILLELAFEKPLQDMHSTSDHGLGLPPGMLDLQTATRQSREASMCLGAKYSDIIEKCLYCDFGNGSDLGVPALQEAVHRNVIFELEKLETGFQQLGVF